MTGFNNTNDQTHPQNLSSSSAAAAAAQQPNLHLTTTTKLTNHQPEVLPPSDLKPDQSTETFMKASSDHHLLSEKHSHQSTPSSNSNEKEIEPDQADLQNHADQKTNRHLESEEQDKTTCEKSDGEENVDDQEPLCRICLAGRDDDPSLGRFIQPCLCRGTMAFIHVGCLQRWRVTSPSPKSFYRCDQCGYRYKLRRAKVAGLAENTVILGGVTFMVFFALVIVSGFISNWLLESYSQMTTIDNDWYSNLGSLSYDSTAKIVGEVVGEAVNVLNSQLHLDTTDSRKRPNTSPVRRPNVFTQSLTKSEVSKLKPIQTEDDDSHSYRYVKVKSEKNNQEQSRPSKAYHARPKQSPMITDPEEEEDQETSFFLESIMNKMYTKLEAVIKHTIKGLAFIGVMSFFQLAMSVTLFSPWNFGIRNSVLRMMRTGGTGSRTTGRPGGDPNGIGSMLILIFVLLGVLKAIQSVWRFVRKSSQWALRKIEDGVLDVRSS